MKIVWIDTETTGLDAVRNCVTQVAAILDVDGQVVDRVNLLIRPIEGAVVDAGALAVQKKTLEQVQAHALSSQEAYESFKATLEKWTADGPAEAKGAAFGGQNAPFDVGFVKAWFAKHGDTTTLSKCFNGTTVDTRYLADGLRALGLLRTANSKLGTLAVAYGVPLGEGAHDAMNDITATREIYLAMTKAKAAA